MASFADIRGKFIPMKRLLTITLLILIAGCSDDRKPDVSGIEVKLELVRFEDDLFALDTTNISWLPKRQQMGTHSTNGTPDWLWRWIIINIT